ncbi:hypothetical protein DFH09DRAFT_1290690 [Mycena vulgaris]|nr:hypothetical protein DFH09DRAFT_1290690 [Mycena vulgaris]
MRFSLTTFAALAGLFVGSTQAVCCFMGSGPDPCGLVVVKPLNPVPLASLAPDAVCCCTAASAAACDVDCLNLQSRNNTEAQITAALVGLCAEESNGKTEYCKSCRVDIRANVMAS